MKKNNDYGQTNDRHGYKILKSRLNKVNDRATLLFKACYLYNKTLTGHSLKTANAMRGNKLTPDEIHSALKKGPDYHKVRNFIDNIPQDGMANLSYTVSGLIFSFYNYHKNKYENSFAFYKIGRHD